MFPTPRQAPAARSSVVALAWVLTAAWACPSSVDAQDAPRPRIYSCVDANGKRITSDRPIPQCLAREHKVHAADGTVRAIIPPSMNGEERAAYEAQVRANAEGQAAMLEAVRRDRQLMLRYRNEADHGAARQEALADAQRSIQSSERRLQELASELKPLISEAEFYKGKELPLKLQRQLEANEAGVAAQTNLRSTAVAERDRIQAKFDAELVRLRSLWAGTPAGSLGPLVAAPVAASGLAPAAAKPTRAAKSE